MADERYFFPTVPEGMMSGLSGVTDVVALKAHLKAGGLDIDRLPPAIPALVFREHIRQTAQFVWPDLLEMEALRLTGYHYANGWKETALGRAAAPLLPLIGPKRTLQRLERVFRTGDNFTRPQTEFLSDNQARVTIHETLGLEGFWLGILQGGLDILGREGQVFVAEAESNCTHYLASWR